MDDVLFQARELARKLKAGCSEARVAALARQTAYENKAMRMYLTARDLLTPFVGEKVLDGRPVFFDNIYGPIARGLRGLEIPMLQIGDPDGVYDDLAYCEIGPLSQDDGQLVFWWYCYFYGEVPPEMGVKPLENDAPGHEAAIATVEELRERVIRDLGYNLLAGD